ncbi:VOC family protein [Nesterenkonia pannonica]|uniref:VOC family protein n=1 Tax=Nesterenkonia pannonica TaxID=1548602 RepID=UPI002164D361|nr:VOC family protein [Nesterenkonia pannonica]
MDIQHLYSEYIGRAQQVLSALGLEGDVVQLDTVCLEVSSHERYDQLKAQLTEEDARLLSEKEISGRLIAVFAPGAPVGGAGSRWFASFVEIPQPKSGAEPDAEGVKHVQFVTRTGIEAFREKHEHIRFVERGSSANRLLETTHQGTVLRFHDKNLGPSSSRRRLPLFCPRWSSQSLVR